MLVVSYIKNETIVSTNSSDLGTVLFYIYAEKHEIFLLDYSKLFLQV